MASGTETDSPPSTQRSGPVVLLAGQKSSVIPKRGFGDPRLSGSAQVAIDEARHSVRGLAISDFTLFELSLLFRKKQFSLVTDLESFLREVERRFVTLPIAANVALQASALPANYPKDPADRIIGATALIEDIPLLTADPEIRASRAVPTIW